MGFLIERPELNNRVPQPPPPPPVPAQTSSGSEMLRRALAQAHWTLFWERLWPPLARLATLVGLFLALSWLGIWLWLPSHARAIGLGVFFLVAAAALAPFLRLPPPSKSAAPHRQARNSG